MYVSKYSMWRELKLAAATKHGLRLLTSTLANANEHVWRKAPCAVEDDLDMIIIINWS
jgi:hypothetical protein